MGDDDRNGFVESFAQGDPRVRARLVESLYSDMRVLTLGMAASLLAVAVCLVEQPRVWLLAILAGMLTVGLWRIRTTLRFRKEVPDGTLSTDEIDLWEQRYARPAIAYTFLFGLWCLEGALSGSHFGHLTAICVTMANLIGICGRSFALQRLVNAQLAATIGPMAAGLLLEGDAYAVLALWLLPYAFSLTRITQWQRTRFLQVVVGRLEAERDAERFTAALNAVPEAVCLLDAQGDVRVVNGRMARLVNRPASAIQGLGHRALVALMREDRHLPHEVGDQVLAWMHGPRTGRMELRFEVGTPPEPSNRPAHPFTFRLRVEQSSGGGTMVMVEDITREVRDATLLDQATRLDALTGMINRNELRRTLRTALHGAVETGGGDAIGCAVMHVNLRRFQAINEVHGHRFGDAVLVAFAAELDRLSGDGVVCARFGDDDFVLVQSGRDCVDELSHLADRLSHRLDSALHVRGRSVRLEAVMGIASSTVGALDDNRLLKEAGLALASARRRDGSNWALFDAAMEQETEERHRLEADLRHAIATRDPALHLHYQPIVDLRTGRAGLCEALMRWAHPTLGNVPPFKFIPVAEELGLVEEMGRHALEEACRACGQWPGDTKVAVNLSALQLGSDAVLDDVARALRVSGLAPQRLELEVTESAVMTDMNAAVRRLEALKEMGVRIALDDFGTGYSSLGHLRRLPLDKVKVDRAFVKELSTSEAARDMVAGIVALAHRIGLEVTVEGVEDAETLKLLMDAKADLIQGWLFAKAEPAARAAPLMDPATTQGRAMLQPLRPFNRRKGVSVRYETPALTTPEPVAQPAPARR